MTPAIASALMPFMRGMDPETAHGIALRGLSLGLAGQDRGTNHSSLATEVAGLSFRNPLGLAAGFDKNAEAVLPLLRLGFGFMEAGTVTPRPQIGNPRPRIFRLAEDRAVINRLGFNNAGLDAFLSRLKALPRPLPGILGANIGINKEGADPERDYPALYEALAPWVDYVTVNVSSPNTPGLRDLQGEERLASILAAINARRAALAQRPPLFVKIAPDLAEDALGPIVEACVAQGIAGLIISNTTISRPASLQSPLKNQAGGLSGAPLFAPSTALLRRGYSLARGRIALIGVGGIASAEQAYAKLRAGAALLQLYSGLAYAGPVLVRQILDGLAALLARDGFTSVADAVGKDA